MDVKNRDGFRLCSCCKKEKELNSENFCSDKNRRHGFSYRCRKCDSSKKDHRRERYKKMPTDQKERHKKKNKEYRSDGYGRATCMVSSYKGIDRKKGLDCDIDKYFLVENIFKKECFYCGEKGKLGCDRIDNEKGHLRDNVVPCCRSCNTTRMNNYSHEEMIIIGDAIRLIKKLRLCQG